MKREMNTDTAAAGAYASAAASRATTVRTVAKSGAAAAAPAAASVLISCFISFHSFLIFGFNFVVNFVTFVLHIGVRSSCCCDAKCRENFAPSDLEFGTSL